MAATEQEPRRIQLSRRKGWRKPDGAVVVSRPTKWGNPFRAGERSPHNYNIIMDRDHAVLLFREMLEVKAEFGVLDEYLAPLRGKDLCCWCPVGKPCHADVLLELANRPEPR